MGGPRPPLVPLIIRHWVAARCLGLTVPINSGIWTVHGLARFPQGHGLNHDFQQFVTAGAKRAGFVPLNDKEFHWFLTGKATWIGMPFLMLHMISILKDKLGGTGR